jgi:ankyrin repeat protein
MSAVSDVVTPLHIAASSNACAVINCLINQHNYDPLRRTDTGETPLHYAAINGHDRAVRMLLENGDGHDLATCDSDGANALYVACEYGHYNVVQLMLSEPYCKIQRRCINSKTVQGYTPLHACVKYGCIECVKIIVENGGRVWENNGRGDTPFFCTAYCDARYNIFRYLLNVMRHSVSKKWESRNENDIDATMLHILDTRVNNTSKRILDIACSNNSIGIVNHLINLGCYCGPYKYYYHDKKDNYNRRKTVGSFMKDKEQLNYTNDTIDEDYDCVKISPMAKAAEKGHLDIVSMLLATRKVKVDEVSGVDRSTACMQAVAKAKPKVVKYLLRCGADLRVADKHGRSLHKDAQKFLPNKPDKSAGEGAAALRKYRTKVKKLLTYAVSPWNQKVEDNSWSLWGIAVAKLVLDGVPEVETGWGLGEQGIDMRREIMKFLTRDDFIARGTSSAGRTRELTSSELVTSDFWFNQIPGFAIDGAAGSDEEGSGGGSDDDEEEQDNNNKKKGSNFRAQASFRIPDEARGFERGSVCM